MFIIVLIRFHSLGGDLPPPLKIIHGVPSEGAFITFCNSRPLVKIITC
jgi:hypothetical protein